MTDRLLGGALNIPNLLTLLRIVLVPVFVNLVVYDYILYALGVFLLAGVTDALDGLIARLANQRTTLGRYLDPLADKLLLVTSFIVLSVLGPIPVWATVIIVSRDVIVSIGALVVHLISEHVNVTPTWLGKGTTVAQLLYVIGALAAMVTPSTAFALDGLLIATLGLTIASGVQYVYRGIRALSSEGGP